MSFQSFIVFVTQRRQVIRGNGKTIGIYGLKTLLECEEQDIIGN
jgi:hypothetical protein